MWFWKKSAKAKKSIQQPAVNLNQQPAQAVFLNDISFVDLVKKLHKGVTTVSVYWRFRADENLSIESEIFFGIALNLPLLDSILLGGLYFPKPLCKLVFGTPASQTLIKIEFWELPEKLVGEIDVFGKGLVTNSRVANLIVRYSSETLDPVGFLHLLLCSPSSPIISIHLPGPWWKQLTKVFHKRVAKESKLNSKLVEVVLLCYDAFYVGPLAAEVGRSSTVTCLDKRIGSWWLYNWT